MRNLTFTSIYVALTVTCASCDASEKRDSNRFIIKASSGTVHESKRDSVSVINLKAKGEQRLRLAYAYLIGADILVPDTFAEFKTAMNNVQRRKTLYQLLKGKGIVVPATFEEFEKALWPVEKKL